MREKTLKKLIRESLKESLNRYIISEERNADFLSEAHDNAMKLIEDIKNSVNDEFNNAIYFYTKAMSDFRAGFNDVIVDDVSETFDNGEIEIVFSTDVTTSLKYPNKNPQDDKSNELEDRANEFYDEKYGRYKAYVTEKQGNIFLVLVIKMFDGMNMDDLTKNIINNSYNDFHIE